MDDPSERRIALRRFSGVLMRANGLSTLDEATTVFGSLFEGKGKLVRVGVPTGWQIRVTEMYHRRSLYPASIGPTPDSSGDRYGHTVYLGSATFKLGEAKRSSWVLLASPYVRLFADLKRLLQDRMNLKFLAPDMKMLFSHFEEHRAGLRVPRIVVQMFGDVGVETVALSGRSPLRSELREALENVSRPYAIRIADTTQDVGTSVSFDKRGAVWWHLRTQNQFAYILNLVRLVDDIGAFVTTSRWPTLPAEPALKAPTK